MDRTSIIVVLICFVLLLAWVPLMNSLYPPRPQETSRTNRVGQVDTNRPSVTPSTDGPQEGSQPTKSRKDRTLPFEQPSAWQAEEETVEVLENENAFYTFTSHGGGLKQVELKGHPQEIQCGADQSMTNQPLVTLNDQAPRPLMAAESADRWLQDAVFDFERQSRNRLVARTTLTNQLQVAHTFELGSNYLVKATVRLENQGQEALELPRHNRVVGTATPINPSDQGRFQGVFWYDGESSKHIGQSWFANTKLGCIPGTPRAHYTGGSNLVWTAVHNRFYTILSMPEEPAPSLSATKVPLPMGTNTLSQAGSLPTGYLASLRYPPIKLEPSESWERHYSLFIGPKKFSILSDFEDDQDRIMNFGIFGILSKALLSSMNGLNHLGLTYGWAIVAITIIIKLLFWPLTRAGTRSMKRMQALQPQMKEIQEKYKDDPTKMNQKLMEFMKQNKVNPMGGCLPMLVQMPVFVGFLFMIKSAVELRGSGFLWVCDLSQPDTVWTIPGIEFPVNPLPILMAVTMLWQTSLSPATPGVDPTQQKMMKYMPLVIVIFLYNFSSGMTLYWTVQNILTVIQTKMTKATDSEEAAQPQKPKTPPKPAPVPGGKKKKKKRSRS